MRLLHLSDIHFKDPEIATAADPNRALRSDLIEDIKLMRATLGPPDVVLLSGDIAFKGAWTEYAFALKWLEEQLCPAANCAMENVFCVPGNHDVDRKVGGEAFNTLIRNELRAQEPRKVDDLIRKYLADGKAGPTLHAPIEHYNRFAARFLCQLLSSNQPSPNSFGRR